MSEYFFMYAVAFAAVLFAVIQDIRTREIANWITFSLIAFVLAYRAFYAVFLEDYMFLVYGVIGIFLFIALGYAFYYSKVFAGGDAKLLFGLGGIFPYASFYDYIYYGFGFILTLFTFGVIYTLIYSIFLTGRNYAIFRKSFIKNISKLKIYFVFSFIGGVLVYLLFNENSLSTFFFSIFIICMPLLFAYVRSVESSCMIKLVSPQVLTEGDWLERDVVVGKHRIKKSFEGLSFDQILLLRKFGKKVWIKNGIPFAPAFLMALISFIIITYFI